MLAAPCSAAPILVMRHQKRLEELHQSQVKAYREAATRAIQSWATALPLEPMEENDTEETFVDRCVSALVSSGNSGDATTSSAASPMIPSWKLDSAKALASDEIRKRAKAVYVRYHPADDEANGDILVAGDAEGEGEDGEDDKTGDEAEDGEEDENSNEEEGKVEQQKEPGTVSGSNAKQQPQARNTNRNNKSKGGSDSNTKSTPVKKKATNAKSYRGSRSQANRGGRRGGRGGGSNDRSTS